MSYNQRPYKNKSTLQGCTILMTLLIPIAVDKKMYCCKDIHINYNQIILVRSGSLLVDTIKIILSWDIMPYSLVDRHLCKNNHNPNQGAAMVPIL
jgi:hypothetical protein